MTWDDVSAAKKTLSGDVENIKVYAKGVEELQNVADYTELHDDALTAMQTWRNGWAIFEEKSHTVERQARYALTTYFISTKLFVDYLSVQLLARAFQPAVHPSALPGPIKSMDQHEREPLLVQLDVIDDSTKQSIAGLRGIRNQIAHELEKSRDISLDERYIAWITNSNKGVAVLIETLYGSPTEHIVDVVDKYFSHPSDPDITTWSAGQLIRFCRRAKYSLVQKYGHLDPESDNVPQSLYDDIEQWLDTIRLLEDELRDRGYDSESALYSELSVSASSKHITKQPAGQNTLIEIAESNLPETAEVNDPLGFSITIRPTSELTTRHIDLDTDDMKWYGLLLVDSSVVDVHPTNREGECAPAPIALGSSDTACFEYSFQESGSYSVALGAQIETETQAVTARTETITVDVQKRGSVNYDEIFRGRR